MTSDFGKKLTRLAYDYSRGKEADRMGYSEADPITWNQVWDAALEDQVITTNVSSHTTMIVVDAARRGPAMSHDVTTLRHIWETTQIRRFALARIPHAMLAHDFGYLIRGLSLKTQRAISQEVTTDIDSGGVVHISTAGSTSLQESAEKGTPIWTAESSQVIVDLPRNMAQETMEQANVSPAVIDRISAGMPETSITLDQFMSSMSIAALGLLLPDIPGLEITTPSLPVLPGDISHVGTAHVQQKIAKFMQMLDHERAPWYGTLVSAINKTLKDRKGLSFSEAAKAWERLAKRNKAAEDALQPSEDLFAQAQLRSASPAEALLASLISTQDMGANLLTAIKDSFGLNGFRPSESVKYVKGSSAFLAILSMALQNPEYSVAFQPFEGRQETGLQVQSIVSSVEERGKPVQGISVSTRDKNTYNVSILKALAQLS